MEIADSFLKSKKAGNTPKKRENGIPAKNWDVSDFFFRLIQDIHDFSFFSTDKIPDFFPATTRRNLRVFQHQMAKYFTIVIWLIFFLLSYAPINSKIVIFWNFVKNKCFAESCEKIHSIKIMTLAYRAVAQKSQNSRTVYHILGYFRSFSFFRNFISFRTSTIPAISIQYSSHNDLHVVDANWRPGINEQKLNCLIKFHE